MNLIKYLSSVVLILYLYGIGQNANAQNVATEPEVPVATPIAIVNHTETINYVGLDALGKYIGTTGSDNLANIWDITEINERGSGWAPSLFRTMRHYNDVLHIELADNLAITSSDDDSAKLWNLEEFHINGFGEKAPEYRAYLSHQDRYSVEFNRISPDRQQVLYLSRQGGVLLFDLGEISVKRVADDSNTWYDDNFYFGPNRGDLYDSMGVDAPEAEIIRYIWHKTHIIDAVFSPDGRYIATLSRSFGDTKAKVIIWKNDDQFKHGKKGRRMPLILSENELEGKVGNDISIIGRDHEGKDNGAGVGLNQLRFRSDGHLLAVNHGTQVSFLDLGDISNNELGIPEASLYARVEHGQTIHTYDIDDAWNNLVTGSLRKIIVWSFRLADVEGVSTLRAESRIDFDDSINQVAMAHQGNTIAIARNTDLTFYDLEDYVFGGSFRQLRPVQSMPHPARISSVQYTTDDRQLVSSADNACMIWDVDVDVSSDAGTLLPAVFLLLLTSGISFYQLF